MLERYDGWAARHWRWLVLAGWLVLASYFLWSKWASIHGFGFGDTDDNLRLVQVRDWLDGQGWFDLRQHRFDPAHGGGNIHWSRLVDLPIAGLILLLRPFLGPHGAEMWAGAVAPLLALLAALTGLALLTKRLVAAGAIPVAIAALFFAGSANGMFQPLRVDHHGWQLAFLLFALAGLADERRIRGGLTVGAATALSLSVGLELLIYLAIAGAAQVLFWVARAEQRERLAAYAASLAGGTGLGFLLFASEANRAFVCDALSPVWTADMVLAGGLLLALSKAKAERWTVRLALAAGAGLLLAAFHAIAFPHCLQRLEGVSPEATQLWLSHVREARPLYRQKAEIAALTLTIPLTGLIGWLVLAFRARKDGERLARTLGPAAVAITALALLAWQTRTGPAAQLLAIPGAAALGWLFIPRAQGSGNMLVRVFGTAALALLAVGALVPFIQDYWPKGNADRPARVAMMRKVNKANRLCASETEMRRVGTQPAGLVFTYIDFGPRLINLTHHSAIGGPYHRNDEAIANVMKAFRGDAAQARRIVVDEYRSDYVLVCPDQSTSTIFSSEAPKGFYVQLVGGKVPAWLVPVDLGKGSPFLMWRVRR